MIKRLLLAFATLLVCVASMSAQYFGTTLFVEGFDGDEFPQEWTQLNESEGNLTQWTLSDIDRPKFSTIDSQSKRSAKIMVKGRDTKLTLTSPEIDATGKSNIQAGFYGYELSYAFRGGMDFRFRASHDGGQTWTDLFASLQGSSYAGTPVESWNLYRYTLPPEFDGKRILLQFYVDASPVANPQSLAGYVDGVFVSLLPECDIELTGINYSTNDRRPTTGVFGDAEMLTLTLRNAGTHELTEAEVYYTVNDGEEVAEKCVFDTPLAMGQEMEYSFRAGVDLSIPRSTMAIKAGVRVEGDQNNSNNEITGYAENTVVTVPYIPQFVYDDGGVTVTGTDDWQTFERNSEYGWDWDDWDSFYWYVDTGWNDDPNDAFLVSRPVSMQAGVSYRLQFSAFSEEESSGLNKMKVYICTDPEMEIDPIEIWSSENITEDNALNQSVLFTVPTTGFWYLGFHSLSEPEAAIMHLEDIALYKNVDNDASLAAVVTPIGKAYTYTSQEKVAVKIANYGTRPIAAGTLKAKVSVDGATVIEETVNKDIASNTTEDFVFESTLDLSDLGTMHEISIWVELSGDEDAENNRRDFTLESDVTLVPYIPDLGTQVKKGGDVNRWYGVDDNNDGYGFTPFGDALLDSYSYYYGGGMYGFTNVTLPSSDDHLMSRHISMTGGKSYKLSYLSRIGKDGGELPLEIKLCNASDGSVVGTVAQTTVGHTDYRENIVTFDVEDDGIYQLEFAVVDDKPIDYRIYLGKFRLSENLSRDLSIEEIVLPSSYVSGIRSFPVGVTVRNNGTQPVTGFSLEAVSASVGSKSVTFDNVTLSPDSEYLIYFNDDFNFTGDDRETLSVTLACDGDEYALNNTLKRDVVYLDPYDLPYNLPVDEVVERVGTYNLNRDSYRFMPDRTIGVGFMYLSDGTTEVNDYVATPAMNLRKDAANRVSFSYYVLDGDTTDFEVFAYNAATDSSVPVINMNSVDQTDLSRYIGFFDVPADGAYNICIRPKGMAASLFINASVSVEETAGLPDIVVGSMILPREDAVFGDNERVVVEFTSEADQGVQCVPFELEVGDDIYTSYFTKYTSRNEGDTYTVAFDGVDLNAPGEYSLVCRAVVPLDRTPANNEARFTLRSLPVVDVAVTQLVSPVSGKSGKTEKVTVTVTNNGKGDVEGVTLSCSMYGSSGNTTVLTGSIDDAIPAGESVEYTFAETVDMFAEGVYTFTVKAEAEGDVRPEDNELTVSVNSTHKDFDAGVAGISSPVDDAFGDAERVTVFVANYGEADLFEVPVRVEVLYAVDETPMVLSGTVAAVSIGETVEYTLPGVVDMKRCGEYRVTAMTMLPNDSNEANDAFETTVRCLTQDVGVTAIISPVSGVDLGICDVTVAVTNFGEADVEDIPMRYQIGAMPQLAVMTGSLKPGETKEFTFPVPYEFTSFRTATMKAATCLENDANPANDEIEAIIENRSSGIDGISLAAGVWPNPTSGVLNVNAGGASIDRVEIFDMSGALASVFHCNGETCVSFTIDVPCGHYLLRVRTTDNHTATTRIVVK